MSPFVLEDVPALRLPFLPFDNQPLMLSLSEHLHMFSSDPQVRADHR